MTRKNRTSSFGSGKKFRNSGLPILVTTGPDGKALVALSYVCAPGILAPAAVMNVRNVTDVLELLADGLNVPELRVIGEFGVESLRRCIAHFRGKEKSELLRWVQSKVPFWNVTNFTSDWEDGQLLLALAAACAPGSVDLSLVAGIRNLRDGELFFG